MGSSEKKLEINLKANDSIISTLFWGLFPAQFCGVAIGSLGSIISGLLVGNGLSSTALAALGFVVPLSTIISSLSCTVYGGARIICGESIGKGDTKGQKIIFSTCVYLLVAIGVLIMILELSFSNIIAKLIGAEGSLTEPTALYIRGIAIGVVPTLLIPCLIVFLQLHNDSRYALASPCILACLSLLFGVLNLKAFNGGILGMGLADSLSKWITFAIIVNRFIKKKSLSLVRKVLPQKDFSTMLVLGLPTALAQILYAFRNSVLNSMALKSFGEETVAALAILGSSMGPFDAVNIAVSTVSLTLFALYTGMKDNESVVKSINVSLKLGMLLSIVKTVFLLLTAGILARIFGATGSLQDTAALLIRLYALSAPLNIITGVISSAYQCAGKVKLVTLYLVLNAVIFPLGWTWLTINGMMGLVGLGLCYTVAEVFSLFFFYGIGFAEGRKTLHVSQLVELPKCGGEYMNFSVSTLDQVAEASEILIDFCESKGIDKKRSYYCGLCVEELAGNSVEHGFAVSKKKKNYAVDIYLHIEDGNIELRVIDNCPEFNPLEQMSSSDDLAENIGIRIVQKLADYFSYQCAFGKNVISASWLSNTLKI